jgi:hypothetical protein
MRLPLFHGEEGGPEILAGESAPVIHLRGELCEVFVFEGVFCRNSLLGIIDQQLGEDVLEILSTACWEELLKSDALLGSEIDVHVSGLAAEAIDDFLLGRAQNVVYAVDLVEFVLAGKERFLGDELEEDTAEAPHVHLLGVVPVGHEALRGSIPSGGDVVSVWRR